MGGIYQRIYGRHQRRGRGLIVCLFGSFVLFFERGLIVDLMQYAGDTQDSGLLKGPEPIPQGFYSVAVSKAESKVDPQKGTQSVVFRFAVLDGPHRGRTVGAVMGLVNPANRDRETYSRRDFAKLNLAVGGPFAQPETYLGRQLVIKVVVGKGSSGDYENYIREYHPAGYQAPGESMPGQTTAYQPPATPPQPVAPVQPPAGYQPPPLGPTQAPTPPAPGQPPVNPWARR
jgi:hypothetical protein